jgi:hypothetical protein
VMPRLPRLLVWRVRPSRCIHQEFTCLAGFCDPSSIHHYSFSSIGKLAFRYQDWKTGIAGTFYAECIANCSHSWPVHCAHISRKDHMELLDK